MKTDSETNQIVNANTESSNVELSTKLVMLKPLHSIADINPKVLTKPVKASHTDFETAIELNQIKQI